MTQAPSIPVRSLGLEDATAYRALMLEAYAAHPEAFGSTEKERAALPMRWWEERLAGGDGEVFGADAEDGLAGVVGVSFDKRAKMRHKAMLFGLYVRASQRGRRLGAALVDAVLRAATARPGCRVIQVSVLEGNQAAQRLYEGHGFQLFGVEPQAVHVGDRYLNKLHLWREVTSEESP